DERAAAMERLAGRLSATRGAALTRHPGETGQNFVHALGYLGARRRGSEGVESLGRHLAAGLDISFLYPAQIEHQLAAGDPTGACQTAELMRARIPFHRGDYAGGEVLHGVAHLALGARERGLRHIANGIWHEPDGTLARMVAGLLLQTDALGPSNFLPLSPAAALIRRRQLRLVPEEAHLAPLRTFVGALPPQVPGIDPLAWDWGGLMRTSSPAAIARHPHREGLERGLAKLPTDPDAASLRALYGALTGAAGPAVGALEDLARTHPDTALLRHRLAVARMLERNFEGALAAASRVAELDPKVAGYHAWQGLAALRAREPETARDALAAARALGLHLPSIAAHQAEAALALGDREAGLRHLGEAIADAPGEQNYRYDRAALQAGAGAFRAALEDLETLLRLERRAPKVMALLAECLTATGQRQAAEEVLVAALAENPDHPRLAGDLLELRRAG
ncbi:MAG: tetratricopeptide repeat protein, partial [Pseudomonadota bacterium]